MRFEKRNTLACHRVDTSVGWYVNGLFVGQACYAQQRIESPWNLPVPASEAIARRDVFIQLLVLDVRVFVAGPNHGTRPVFSPEIL